MHTIYSNSFSCQLRSKLLTSLQGAPSPTEGWATLLAAIFRLLQNLTVFGGLAKAASAEAGRPSRPLRHLTVHWDYGGFWCFSRWWHCILTGLHAILTSHKVIPITSTSAVRKGLTLSSSTVKSVSHEAATTRTLFCGLLADGLCVFPGKETVRTFSTLPLLVHGLTPFTFGFLRRFSCEQSRSDSHSSSAGGTAGTPVTPRCSGAHGVRGINISNEAIWGHALLLLHDCNVRTLLATHIVHEGSGAHGNSDATSRRTFRPRSPPGSLANSHALSAIIYGGTQPTDIFRIGLFIGTATGD